MMTVSVIEGVVGEVVRGRSPPVGHGTIYKRATWQEDGGGTTSIKRFVVDRSMNPVLESGKAGRFYRSKALGGNSIFGYRGAGGESLFAWPRGIRSTAIMMVVVGALLVLMVLLTRNAIAFLGVIIFIFGIAMIVTDNSERKSGRALFDGDTPG